MSFRTRACAGRVSIACCALVLFATPIWWSHHSSLIQRAIERLDALHDEVMDGKRSPLEGKAGGIIITGDSDGAQQVIGGICNFFNAIGLVVPPYATLSVLWERQAKGADPSEEELLAYYQQYYDSSIKYEQVVSQFDPVGVT